MQFSDLARGRWRKVLPLLGISVRFLTNKHGPCPMCGGKDRFRFDDKQGEGTYICGQCGAGNGWTLARKFNGWDAATTNREIEAIVGQWKGRPVPAPVAPSQEGSASAAKLLSESTSPFVVEDYLLRRGIGASSTVLRGHQRCPYFVEDASNGRKRWRVLGHFPAVVAPIVNKAGVMIGVQRVYDGEVDERKKVLGDLKGGVVRLWEPTDELGVCEGWETGMAAYELFGIPIWATLTAGNLIEFEPPAGIMRLHVFGDNDENSVGQAAAYTLAVRVNRWNKQHNTGADLVRVHIPSDPGADWLDVRTGKARLDGTMRGAT